MSAKKEKGTVTSSFFTKSKNYFKKNYTLYIYHCDDDKYIEVLKLQFLKTKTYLYIPFKYLKCFTNFLKKDQFFSKKNHKKI